MVGAATFPPPTHSELRLEVLCNTLQRDKWEPLAHFCINSQTFHASQSLVHTTAENLTHTAPI